MYGDAILWLQLIDYAKSEKKPIIFVTDDDKEDWWLESGGKTISPRPELVQEMLTEAGVKFYMYSADRFLDYAQKFLHLSEQPEVIEEAKEIREQNVEFEPFITYQNFYQADQTRLQKYLCDASTVRYITVVLYCYMHCTVKKRNSTTENTNTSCPFHPSKPHHQQTHHLFSDNH
jgi:hypothetical protein